jgi:cytidylate kinase
MTNVKSSNLPDSKYNINLGDPVNKSTGRAFIITIDGPAGSGKSTVSSLLAQRLNLNFLTTGAFYRGLAFLCRKKTVEIKDSDVVASLATYEKFKVFASIEGTKVFIDDEDITHELASEAVAYVASQISAYPKVRAALLELQRAFNQPPGLIAEGRDCGTVVFPKADVKIFLTASLDKRAERRSSEEKNSSSQDLQQKMATRDKSDAERKAAPMAKAADTIEIDSSSLSASEVVEKIEKLVREKWKT